MTTSVKVGIIQMTNTHCHPQDFLNSIQSLIDEAGSNHVQLLLLPEFATTKYRWHSDQYRYAQDIDSGTDPTIESLSKQCIKHQMHIGCTLLESDSLTCHYYNTFILINDKGTIISKIRKNSPCSFERWYWNTWNCSHLIKTSTFGTIAMGICFENHFSFFENEIIKNKSNINIILMPHSVMYAEPYPSLGWSEEMCNDVNDTINNIALNYSKTHKKCVLFSNKCGAVNSPMPLIPSWLDKLNLAQYTDCFSGNSKIIDQNGNILACCMDGRDKSATNQLIMAEISIGIPIESNDSNSDVNVKDIDDDDDDVCLNQKIWSSANHLTSIQKKLLLFQGILGGLYYKLSLKRRLLSLKKMKLSFWNVLNVLYIILFLFILSIFDLWFLYASISNITIVDKQGSGECDDLYVFGIIGSVIGLSHNIAKHLQFGLAFELDPNKKIFRLCELFFAIMFIGCGVFAIVEYFDLFLSYVDNDHVDNKDFQDCSSKNELWIVVGIWSVVKLLNGVSMLIHAIVGYYR